MEAAGVRMSFAARLDHHAILYRRTTTQNPANGETVTTWAAQTSPAGKNAHPDQSWSGVLQEQGPLERQASRRRWFLAKGFADVREQDVLDVTEGPDAPLKLRVESVTRATNGRGVLHHFEVNVSTWDGSLT